MKTILLVVVIAIVLLFSFDGWGGYEKAGFEPRINYLPMRVYYLDLDLGPTPSAHLGLNCWMLPFERYIIHDGALSTQMVPGMVTVDSGRCRGYAPVGVK